MRSAHAHAQVDAHRRAQVDAQENAQANAKVNAQADKLSPQVHPHVHFHLVVFKVDFWAKVDLIREHAHK